MTGNLVGSRGMLSVQGGRIVDRNGHPLTLRGMSLFWSHWMPKYYNADIVKWLRDDWKINVIRASIAVHRGGYLDNPDEEFQRAVGIVDAAISLGIYVICDWHAHIREEVAAKSFFYRLAQLYANCPNLIFEPWNEPEQRYKWQEDIKPYHISVAQAIRSHCPDNLIIAGTENFSQRVDKAAMDPLPDKNMAYTLHFYAASHRGILRQRVDDAVTAGIALVVTEFGTCEASGDGRFDPDETRVWWEFLEAHGIGTINWAISDKNEAASALNSSAPITGNWRDEHLTQSGRFVREHIRSFHKDLQS